MKAIKLLAIAPIVAGLVGFASGSFTYPHETHEANLRPINLTVQDREAVNLLVWAVVIGGGLMLLGTKRS